MTKLRKIFVRKLREIRRRKNLTQEQLAERLNISVRYVQVLESKKCPNIKLDTLGKLAKALKVKPIDFLID